MSQEKPRLTEAEQIKSFLTDLRAAGVDPGFMAAMLPWLSATGGTLSGPLNRAMEIIQSDAPVRARAKQVGAILAQIVAQSVRSF
jgi:hypothetical protein